MPVKKRNPTGETHVLSTMEEIAKVVTVDNFADLMRCITLSFSHVAQLKKAGVDLTQIKFTAIKWTDDGYNEVNSITFTPIKKKK